jgi:hypothetical protein
MLGGYKLCVIVRREGGQSASYIQEEWSRGCRPRAITDFPVILFIFIK